MPSKNAVAEAERIHLNHSSAMPAMNVGAAADSETVSSHDRIIVLVGAIGAGKTTFIERATGQGGQMVGHDLAPATQELRLVRVTHQKNRYPVVFLDTPGFDDTCRTDAEILTMIANWLKDRDKQKIKLTGVIFLQRICDNRISGPTLEIFKAFASMCGNRAMRNVVLVTTMWSGVASELGARREAELKNEYWKEMLDCGCRTMRFKNTPESAWEIVDSILWNGHVTLDIQRQMRKGIPATQTSAGAILNKPSLFQRFLKKIGLTGG